MIRFFIPPLTDEESLQLGWAVQEACFHRLTPSQLNGLGELAKKAGLIAEVGDQEVYIRIQDKAAPPAAP